LEGGSAIAASAFWATAATPARAGDITFDYTAYVEGSLALDPVGLDTIAILLGETPPLLSDPVELDFAEFLAGSLTTLDDPAQYLDGDLELGIDLVASFFGEAISADEIALLDPFFDIGLSGLGELVTFTNQVLEFAIDYDSTLKALLLTFDPAQATIIDDCLVGFCDVFAGFGFFADLTLPGTPMTPLAEGEVSLAATIEPRGESVPEPSALLGLLAGAGWLATRRRAA